MLSAIAFAANLAQAAPAAPSSAPPPNAVRVHFHTPRDRGEARLFVRTGADQWALVCSAPCKADLPPGAQLRAVLEDHDDEPHDFVLTNDMGHEVDLEARRAGRGALAGGIVMTSLGGVTALVGIVLVAVGSALSSGSDLRTGGLVCLGIGVGTTIGGITLIANRTYEPNIRQKPWHPPEWAGLARTLPVAVTPLSLTIRF